MESRQIMAGSFLSAKTEEVGWVCSRSWYLPAANLCECGIGACPCVVYAFSPAPLQVLQGNIDTNDPLNALDADEEPTGTYFLCFAKVRAP